MKRSSFWFLFLFFCLVAGFIHGILPNNKETLKINIENSALTQAQVQSLLQAFSYQQNLPIEYTKINEADFVFSKRPIKSIHPVKTSFTSIAQRIHPDFLIKGANSFPLFWQINDQQLVIEYFCVMNQNLIELNNDILDYLYNWERQINLLSQTPYASTLLEEPHQQIDAKKKASYIRQFQLTDLKITQ